MSKRTLVWIIGSLLAICASSFAQNQEKLNARELFYGTPKKPATTTAGNSQGGNGTKAGTPTGQQTASGGNRNGVPIPSDRPQGQTGGPKVIPVEYSPLGLRYSLLRRSGAQYDEVDVDSVFRSGDGIRLTIESNDDAYLYIVNKGSSGTWTPLFPSSQIDNGNNHVQAHRRYEVPAGGQFTFENPPGEERLFVVLSREPEADLEGLMYTLSRRGDTPAGGSSPKVLSVQNNISDDLIGKIRSQSAVLSRDLVFEKVDEKTSDQTSAKKEKAAYVVNASATLNGRVISDVTLKHR
jgi:Domain of unknown function (DUF4384)